MTIGVGPAQTAEITNHYIKMNIYELTHTAQCPNGQLMDSYQITIKSARTIQVERILETLKQAPAKIYQEDLATFLRSRIAGELIIIGWHHGIKITTHLL